MNKLLALLSLAFLLTSCEEEITLEMPDHSTKVVVEGYIQPNQPIVVQLTSSKGYFDEITENELMDVFLSDVTNIKVIRNSDNIPVYLDFVPLGNDVGFYSEADFSDWGNIIYDSTFAQFGESYTLEIIYNGDTITSTTTIPYVQDENNPMIDSVWYVEDERFPGFGDFYFSYNDPDTMGNNIMLEAKRMKSVNGTDLRFVKANWGAVRNDFNGFNGVKHFVSYFDRGNDNIFSDAPGHKKDGDFGNYRAAQMNDSTGIMDPADEVIIRFSQIDEAAFNFWRDTEYQEQTNGNPFAEPINLSHNINGGFGIWEGKGTIYYKVIAEEDNASLTPFVPTNDEENFWVIF